MRDPLSTILAEPARIAAIRDAVRARPYPHPSYDALAQIAARVIGVPVALVSLVDDRDQVFAGATGLTDELATCRSTPLSQSLCKFVVASQDVLRIDDARLDPRVRDSGAVTELGVVAYLGVPLTTSTGLTLGSMCAIASEPRVWLDADERLLKDLAVAVVAELELRAEVSYREDAVRESDLSLIAEGLPAQSLDILESVQEGVAAVDRQWRVTFLNRFAARILGVDRDMVLGHGVWEQIPFLESTSIGDAMRLAAANRFPTEAEAYVPSLRRWFEVRAIPVRRGISIYFQDVTERREAQAALVMREEQLRHAQKMDAIGTLAGGVAHDFNNLLTVIRANVELLQSHPAIRAARYDELPEILSATARAAVLTRQLLAFSRKQVVQERVLDVAVAVANLSPILQRLMPAAVQLETKVYPNTPPVMADAGQIEQLVMNLVLNARDASADGGTVHVRLSPITLHAPLRTVSGTIEAGDYLQLVVRDSGSGIPADVLPRIFEPFFSTKADGRGAGLGLATVFGIVQQARGGIAVDTAEGAGTLVRVYLPSASAMQATAELPIANMPRGKERILIADDEPGVLTIVRRILEGDGYSLLTAADGQDALDKIDAAGGIDLIVTDVIMPNMSGIELVDNIRRRTPSIPVILMSGYGEAASVQERLSEPGVRFISKPFSAGVLSDTVRKLLASRPQN
jgi:PAS domain S-box-containing protein